MIRRLSILLAASALLLAAAGCGDDDEPDGGNVAAPTTSEATEPADPGQADAEPPAVDGAAGALNIGMRDLKFDPAQATAKVGQLVTWTNLEAVPHNVVAESGASFESDTFGEDGTYQYTPERAGTIAYVCTIHPGMEGTLTVEE